MKNIHVLPTDKPSRLHLQNGNLVLHRLQYTLVSQHIYITNDEEINQNTKPCWCLNTIKKTWNDDVVYFQGTMPQYHYIGFKKIILTTDTDLIKDGVQAIDDKFLEWFVKNPSCESVEVEYGDDGNGYQIIIPKEETCDNCNNDVCCCIVKEEPKQETLEEVAERLCQYVSENPPYTIIKPKSKIEGFIEGYKLAQQQNKNKYSEEEVRNLLIECCGEVSCEDGALIGKSPAELVEWIDTKFKKK